MFSAGGQIAADTTEDLSALEGAETTRDFLLDLRHAEVIFTLVVGKGHEGIGHETEGLGFEFSKTVQQIAGFALGCAFGGSVAGSRRGAFTIASGKDIAVAASKAFSGRFIQTAGSVVPKNFIAL